jgi:predicted nucleic acid-binding protein
VTGFLDTATIVDFLRGYPPCEAWLRQQPSLAVTPIVWLETIEGALNRQAQRKAVALLRHFERVDLTSADFDWSIQKALDLRLSHNVDLMDCLIASVSHRYGSPLYTPNLKHFTPLLGALARKPY